MMLIKIMIVSMKTTTSTTSGIMFTSIVSVGAIMTVFDIVIVMIDSSKMPSVANANVMLS